jgi:hypothetical protein
LVQKLTDRDGTGLGCGSGLEPHSKPAAQRSCLSVFALLKRGPEFEHLQLDLLDFLQKLHLVSIDELLQTVELGKKK